MARLFKTVWHISSFSLQKNIEKTFLGVHILSIILNIIGCVSTPVRGPQSLLARHTCEGRIVSTADEQMANGRDGCFERHGTPMPCCQSFCGVQLEPENAFIIHGLFEDVQKMMKRVTR